MYRPVSSREAIQAGISAGNINITNANGDEGPETMDFSESTVQEQLRHAAALQAVEIQRRARSIVVPTNNEEVKLQLRALGFPVCLFGGEMRVCFFVCN